MRQADTKQNEAQGRIHHLLGSHILPARGRFISIPSHLPTSIAVTPSSLYISTKRGVIFRFALPSLRKLGKPFGQARFIGPKVEAAGSGHKGEILCLAASEDDAWLVSGGRDKVVGVWRVKGGSRWVTGMRGHKDAITVCLAASPELG